MNNPPGEKLAQMDMWEVWKLSFPFAKEKTRAPKVGDKVLLSGVGFARRAAVH